MDMANIHKNEAAITLFIVAFIAGIQPLLLQVLLSKLPRKYILYGTTISNLILYTIYFNLNNEPPKIGLKETTLSTSQIIFIMLCYTALCVTIPNLLYIHTVEHDNVITYNALLYTSPMITLMITYFLFNGEISYKSAIGAFLIVIGSIFIAMH